MFTSNATRRIAVSATVVSLAAAAAACSSSSSSSSTPSSAATGIHAASSSLGSILVDTAGRAIYVFAADSANHSACSGGCLTAWPAVPASASDGASSAGGAILSTLTRSDGTKQLTVNGLPAYYYVADTSPGKASGQGISSYGAKWWVIGPSGTPMTTTSSPSGGSTGGW